MVTLKARAGEQSRGAQSVATIIAALHQVSSMTPDAYNIIIDIEGTSDEVVAKVKSTLDREGYTYDQ